MLLFILLIFLLGAHATHICVDVDETARLSSLVCPPGHQIEEILIASFGTPTGDCSSSSTSYRNDSCHAKASLAVVLNRCIHEESCDVIARSDQFGADPCENVVKRLLVKAVCSDKPTYVNTIDDNRSVDAVVHSDAEGQHTIPSVCRLHFAWDDVDTVVMQDVIVQMSCQLKDEKVEESRILSQEHVNVSITVESTKKTVVVPGTMQLSKTDISHVFEQHTIFRLPLLYTGGTSIKGIPYQSLIAIAIESIDQMSPLRYQFEQKFVLQPRFTDVLLIVNINHFYNLESIENYIQLYKHAFPNMVIVSDNPSLDITTSIGKIHHAYSHAGDFALLNLFWAMEHFPDYNGYMLTNDDVFLNIKRFVDHFDFDKVWVPEVNCFAHCESKAGKDATEYCSMYRGWLWELQCNAKDKGASSNEECQKIIYKQVKNNYKKRLLDMCRRQPAQNGGNPESEDFVIFGGAGDRGNIGGGDFVYVPGSKREEVLDLKDLLPELSVMQLGAQIPILIALLGKDQDEADNVVPANQNQLKAVYLWNENRDLAKQIASGSNSFDVLHPLKPSDSDAMAIIYSKFAGRYSYDGPDTFENFDRLSPNHTVFHEFDKFLHQQSVLENATKLWNRSCKRHEDDVITWVPMSVAHTSIEQPMKALHQVIKSVHNKTVSKCDIDSLRPWQVEREKEDTYKVVNLMQGHFLFRKSGGVQEFPYDTMPYYYRNPDTGEEAIICLTPKVGSSHWKALLVKSQDPQYFSVRQHHLNSDIHNPHVAKLPRVSPETILRKMMNTSIPRIMFTRNPYEKFVSAFIDKSRPEQGDGIDPWDWFGGYDPSKGFEGFLKFILAGSRSGSFSFAGMDHFMPLSDCCMIPHGMQYDYYLKIEHIDHWYGPLLRALGLENAAKKGWNFRSDHSSWYQHNHSQTCFNTVAGRSCEDGNDLDYDLHGGCQGTVEWLKSIPKNQGQRVSQIKELSAYNSSDYLADVHDLFKKDFALFNYPKWNGNSANEFVDDLLDLHCFRLLKSQSIDDPESCKKKSDTQLSPQAFEGVSKETFEHLRKLYSSRKAKNPA